MMSSHDDDAYGGIQKTNDSAVGRTEHHVPEICQDHTLSSRRPSPAQQKPPDNLPSRPNFYYFANPFRAPSRDLAAPSAKSFMHNERTVIHLDGDDQDDDAVPFQNSKEERLSRYDKQREVGKNLQGVPSASKRHQHQDSERSLPPKRAKVVGNQSGREHDTCTSEMIPNNHVVMESASQTILNPQVGETLETGSIQGRSSSENETVSSTSSSSNPRNHAKKRRSGKKRPTREAQMSAFLAFVNARRDEVSGQMPGASQSEIASILACLWKDATNEERQPYFAVAKDSRHHHNDEDDNGAGIGVGNVVTDEMDRKHDANELCLDDGQGEGSSRRPSPGSMEEDELRNRERELQQLHHHNHEHHPYAPYMPTPHLHQGGALYILAPVANGIPPTYGFPPPPHGMPLPPHGMPLLPLPPPPPHVVPPPLEMQLPPGMKYVVCDKNDTDDQQQSEDRQDLLETFFYPEYLRDAIQRAFPQYKSGFTTKRKQSFASS